MNFFKGPPGPFHRISEALLEGVSEALLASGPFEGVFEGFFFIVYYWFPGTMVKA